MKTRDMILCAVFAAMIGIFAVITIPVGAVPMSMCILGILLTALILGAKRAAIAVMIYIFLGAVGLPVFSGFKGGIPVLAGPTGGYISGYILTALFVGYFSEKLAEKKCGTLLFMLISFGGIGICYIIGTIQFMAVTGSSISHSLAVCVAPFIPFDIVKCAIGAMTARSVRGALVRAKLL